MASAAISWTSTRVMADIIALVMKADNVNIQQD
jgi:hypothetical protein